MTEGRDLLARYLRQRREMGGREVVLEGISADEAVARLTARSSGEETARGAAPRPPAPAKHAAGATAPGPVAADLLRIGSLDGLRAVALGCPRCRLSETRTHVVFGEGNESARVVVVGEAPGQEEDRTGRPFVGRAGMLLDLLLSSVGLPRETVYICNVLKCRPPGNRNPQEEEIAACRPYLLRQLQLVAPAAILAAGAFAAQTLLATAEPIGRLRGAVHRFEEIPLVPTYHPAALLRNPSWTRPVWEDLQRLRSILDAA